MDEIDSVASLIDILGGNTILRGHTRLFRGHDQSGLEPSPRVFRSNYMRNEHRSVREFVSAFPQEFDRDATTLEKLVRAQHFEIPTRLLDLTWNPLVALYFACQGQQRQDGEIFCYTIPKLRLKYYDSDTVSILSNLSYLTFEQKRDLTEAVDQQILYDQIEADIEEFNKRPQVQPLLHYIRAEKPHFQPKIRAAQLMGLFFVKPKLNNRRILAQSGAFAVYGLRVPEPKRRKRFSIDRYIIPARYKAEIMDTLSLLNIHKSSVFPEVENAAAYIQSRL